MAASFNMMARLYEALNFPIQALRSNQLASLFASFDYQMKGEEYIDKSPWPIVWKDTVEAALKYMDRVQQVGRRWDWRTKRIPQLTDVYPGSGYPKPDSRSIANDKSRKKMKIMIVSVCQYNSETTP